MIVFLLGEVSVCDNGENARLERACVWRERQLWCASIV